MQDFEYEFAGLSETGQLIYMVDDHQYGICSYAIAETVTDEGFNVELDFLHEQDLEVPDERKTEIVTAILMEIVEQIEKDANLTDDIEE